MTQLSRFKLKPDVNARIYDLLNEVLISFKTKSDLNNFLDDFLSPIEKTVLAKRIAIAVLLAKDRDYESIMYTLKVTPGTISKMSLHLKYGNGAMGKAVNKILQKDSVKIILQEIASIFDVPIKGLPLSEYHKKVSSRNEKIRKLKEEI